MNIYHYTTLRNAISCLRNNKITFSPQDRDRRDIEAAKDKGKNARYFLSLTTDDNFDTAGYIQNKLKDSIHVRVQFVLDLEKIKNNRTVLALEPINISDYDTVRKKKDLQSENEIRLFSNSSELQNLNKYCIKIVINRNWNYRAAAELARDRGYTVEANEIIRLCRDLNIPVFYWDKPTRQYVKGDTRTFGQDIRGKREYEPGGEEDYKDSYKYPEYRYSLELPEGDLITLGKLFGNVLGTFKVRPDEVEGTLWDLVGERVADKDFDTLVRVSKENLTNKIDKSLATELKHLLQHNRKAAEIAKELSFLAGQRRRTASDVLTKTEGKCIHLNFLKMLIVEALNI